MRNPFLELRMPCRVWPSDWVWAWPPKRHLWTLFLDVICGRYSGTSLFGRSLRRHFGPPFWTNHFGRYLGTPFIDAIFGCHFWMQFINYFCPPPSYKKAFLDSLFVPRYFWTPVWNSILDANFSGNLQTCLLIRHLRAPFVDPPF